MQNNKIFILINIVLLSLVIYLNPLYGKGTNKTLKLWKKVFSRLGVEDSIGFLREYNLDAKDIHKLDQLAKLANNNLSFRLISFSEVNTMFSKNQNVLIAQKDTERPTVTVPNEKRSTTAKDTPKGSGSSTKGSTGDTKTKKLRKDEVTEIESELQGQDVIGYEADYIIFVDKDDRKGFKKLVLYGHIEVEMGGKSLETDLVILKMKGNTLSEALGIGDVVFKSGSQIITGNKFYYYPETQKALIINPATYNQPYYVLGKMGKRIDDEKIIVSGGLITTCPLEYPHYYFTTDKIWVYQNDKMFASDLSFYVGRSNLFYFPFIMRTEHATGILTAFGAERGLGWYVNNTYYWQVNDNIFVKLMGDYYQKLGVYFGEQMNITLPLGSLRIDSGVAYDRAVKQEFNREWFSNYVDIGQVGTYKESSNFRYNFATQGNINLAQDQKTGFNSSANFSFSTQGDPFFGQQFGTYRFETFDIMRLIQQEKSPVGLQGSGGIFSSGSGQQFQFSLSNSIDKFRLDISGNFSWVLQRDMTDISKDEPRSNAQTPTDGPLNPYKSSSYKNYRSSFNYPRITMSYGDTLIQNIFGFMTPTRDANKNQNRKQTQPPPPKPWFEDEGVPYHENNILTDMSFYPGIMQSELNNQYIRDRNIMMSDPFGDRFQSGTDYNNYGANFYRQRGADTQYGSRQQTGSRRQQGRTAGQQQQQHKLTITMPLTYSLNASLNETKSYDTLYDVLREDKFDQNQSGNLSAPLRVSYGIFSLNIPNSFQVTNRIMRTKPIEDDPIKTGQNYISNDESSYANYTYRTGLTTNVGFLQDYEWLEMKLGINFGFNIASRFEDVIAEPSTKTVYNNKLGIWEEYQTFESYDDGILVPQYTFKNESGRSKSISYGINYTFLKWNFSANSSERLYINKSDQLLIDYGVKSKEEVLREYRGPWSFSAGWSPVKWFNINQSYSRTRNLPKNRDVSYNINARITVSEPWDITEDIWFNSLSFNAGWNHNYQNLKSDRLNYSANANFYITRDWQVAFSISGDNQNLYLYDRQVAEEYNKEPRSFFDDLLGSMNLFDTKARESSYFKISRFSFDFRHNLHKWEMNLSVQFQARPMFNGSYYFEPSIYFTVYLKDMPSFKAPEIRKVITKQEDYEGR